MLKPEIFLDNSYKGFGHSEGLARGLQIRINGDNLTQEGMGLGTIAIKYNGTTVFSQGYYDEKNEDMIKCRTFFLDSELNIGVKRIPGFNLTHLWDKFTEHYKTSRLHQIFHRISGQFFDWVFQIERAFVKVESKAEAEFCYDISDFIIKVQAEIKIKEVSFSKICLMNEMGADWFTEAKLGGKSFPVPGGWDKLSGDSLPSLYSPKHGLNFSIRDIKVSGNLPFEIFWGRENNSKLCWTGFTIEISPNASLDFQEKIVCSYDVVVENTMIESESQIIK